MARLLRGWLNCNGHDAAAFACDESFSPGLDEGGEGRPVSLAQKLQKPLSEGPSFQVADCRGASPNKDMGAVS